MHVVRPICDAVRDRGRRGDPWSTRPSVRRRRVRPTSRCRRRPLTRRARRSSTRPSAPALEESIRRLRATCEAELEHDVVTDLGPGATVTHRKVPVDRVGLYVPGGLAPLVSSVLMNVVPAQVAGVALDRADQPAAEGARRAAAPDDPGRLRAARRRRGVRRRRRPGDRDVRLRRRSVPARSTWSPVPATSTRSPPSGCSRAWSASTPRPARPRSRSWPTTPPTRRTSPPT